MLRRWRTYLFVPWRGQPAPGDTSTFLAVKNRLENATLGSLLSVEILSTIVGKDAKQNGGFTMPSSRRSDIWWWWGPGSEARRFVGVCTTEIGAVATSRLCFKSFVHPESFSDWTEHAAVLRCFCRTLALNDVVALSGGVMSWRSTTMIRLSQRNYHFGVHPINRAGGLCGDDGRYVEQKWVGPSKEDWTWFLDSWRLKMHCHALQRFYVDFLRSKMAARRLEAPANEKQAFAPLFFFTSFELRDQSTLGYLSVTLAKSFLSRTKMGFEIRSRKWKQKDKFAHKKWGKCMEPKAGLLSSTDRSWVVLVRRSFKTHEAFRCSCVYFATQYNVHYDNRQAGHLLNALSGERCTAAIFSRKQIGAKITE